MSRFVLCAVLALGLLSTPLAAHPAFAERRVALVIGNSAYQNAPALPNPIRDAHSMAEMFQKAGFDVVNAQYDVGYLQFSRAIRQFEDIAATADIAVIYYAGHGVEIHGGNYLVPVDAKLESDQAAKMEAVTLDELQDAIGKAKQLQLIILDACRDNPFVTKTARRGVTPGGLAPVDVAPGNTLIAFAARAGSEALDGSGGHSPFTIALMHNLFVPGLTVQMAFTRVRDEVLKNTHYQQEPFVYGSIGADSIALVPGAEQAPVTVDADAKRDFDMIDTIARSLPADHAINAWKVFLTQHPTGSFSDLARKKVDGLQVASAEQLPLPSSPPPSPESQAQQAWDRIKDSSDVAAFNAFIDKYPTSPLANTARLHVKAIEEQQQKAEAERQRLQAEREAQRAWDRIKSSDNLADFSAFIAQHPASPLADEARSRVQQIEAERQRQAQRAWNRIKDSKKVAEFNAFIAQYPTSPLADEARARMQTIQEEQQRNAAAEQKRQEAQRAWDKIKDSNKIADFSAFIAQYPTSQLADAARARLKAIQEDEQKAATAAKAQQDAEAAAKAQHKADAAAQAQQQAGHAAAEACKNEQDRLTTLQAAGGAAKTDLQRLEAGLTCERLRPQVIAALDHAITLSAVNTPAQVSAAQHELTRLGCYSGAADGALDDPTKAALQHYESERGKSAGKVDVTDDFVSELKKQLARVCPLACPTGQTAAGEHCVAAEKAAPVAAQKDEHEKAERERKAEKGKAARREEAKHEKRKSEPRPHVTQEALRGHSSGGSSTIGVGF